MLLKNKLVAHNRLEEDHLYLNKSQWEERSKEFGFLLRGKIKPVRVLQQGNDLIRHAFCKDHCGCNVEYRFREAKQNKNRKQNKQKHVGKRIPVLVWYTRIVTLAMEKFELIRMPYMNRICRAHLLVCIWMV